MYEFGSASRAAPLSATRSVRRSWSASRTSRGASSSSRRWRSEDDFTEEIDWFRFAHMMSTTEFVVDAIAGATVATVSLGLIWAGGAAGTLVRLAGGRLALGVNVGLELVIKIITKAVRGELSDGSSTTSSASCSHGYVNALGFGLRRGSARASAPDPERAAGRIVDWLVPKLVSGTLSGTSTAPASLFANDVILRVMRDGGSLRSWREYLAAASNGAKFGALGEVGGSAVLESLFYAARVAIKGIGTRRDAAAGRGAAREKRGRSGDVDRRGDGGALALREDARRRRQGRCRRERRRRDAPGDRAGDGTPAHAGRPRPNTHIRLLGLAKANLSRDSVQGIERLATNKARLPEHGRRRLHHRTGRKADDCRQRPEPARRRR